MSDEELYEVVDPSTGLATGRLATSEEVHTDGLWHRTFHLWLVSDRDGGLVYLQRRGADVRHEPLKLDIAAAGHYRAGESLYDGLREADEELGLHEPFLLQQGFISRTPRGRMLTPQAFAHIGLDAPKGFEGSQATLFEDGDAGDA